MFSTNLREGVKTPSNVSLSAKVCVGGPKFADISAKCRCIYAFLNNENLSFIAVICLAMMDLEDLAAFRYVSRREINLMLK